MRGHYRAFEQVQNQIEVSLGVADRQIAIEAIGQFDERHKEAMKNLERLFPESGEKEDLDSHVREFSRVARAFVVKATSAEEASEDKVELGQALKTVTERVRADIAKTLARAHGNYDLTLDEIESYTRRVSARLPTLILALLGVAALLMFWILRSAFRRMAKIQAHFLAADLDSLEPFSEADGGDELSVLASAANRMLDGFKRARASLIEKDFLQTVFRSVKEAIVVVSDEGKILLHNDAWTSLIGSADPELAFRSITAGLSIDVSTRDGGGQERTYRGQWKSADGAVLHLLASEGTLAGGLDGKQATVIALADITKLHRAEEEKVQAEARLAQAAKLASLGEMGVGIAHELNNPLTGIKGFAEIVLNMPETSPKGQEHLKTIIRAADRMRKIIDHIRKFGRTTGQDEMEVVDLRDVIKNAFIIQESQFVSRNIQVNINLSRHPLPLRCDPSQLESVFHNLLSNSRDAFRTRPEGEPKIIDIATAVDPQAMQIVVTFSDTAGGISPEVQQKIFDPFFTTKEVGVGTGLGLSIALGAMKRHQGTIELQPNTPGRAVFVIRLPYQMGLTITPGASTDDSSQDSLHPAHHSLPSSRPRIAIVDDEGDIRSLLKAYLGNAFEITEYGDPLLAAQEIPRAQLDGVITDIRMPGMSGLELIRHLRSTRVSCPIIVISGHAKTESDVAQALESGAQLLIPKPFPRAQELMRVVSGLIKTQATTDHRTRVVLLDDDEGVCDLVRDYLTEKNMRCDTFGAAEPCLAFLSAHKPDLVLCDLTIKGEAPESIVPRVVEAAIGAPVLIMTGLSEKDPSVTAALEAGAVGIITKPFSLDSELMSAVRQWTHSAGKAA